MYHSKISFFLTFLFNSWYGSKDKNSDNKKCVYQIFFLTLSLPTCTLRNTFKVLVKLPKTLYFFEDSCLFCSTPYFRQEVHVGGERVKTGILLSC